MKITAIETFVVNTGFKPPRPWLLLRHPHRRGPDRLQRVRQRRDHARARRARAGPRRAAHRQGSHRRREALRRHVSVDAPGAVRRDAAGDRGDRAGPVGPRGQVARRSRLAAHGRARTASGSACTGRTARRIASRTAELFRVKPLRTMADVADCAREAVAKGYTALKTNIIWPGDPPRRISQGRVGPHDQLATRDIIDQAVAQIGAMREAVGPKVDICLDVNVNFKPSEALLLARELEPFKLFWMEIDNQDAEALVELRAGTRTPALRRRAAPDRAAVPAVSRAPRARHHHGGRLLAGVLGGQEGGGPRRDTRDQRGARTTTTATCRRSRR